MRFSFLKRTPKKPQEATPDNTTKNTGFFSKIKQACGMGTSLSDAEKDRLTEIMIEGDVGVQTTRQMINDIEHYMSQHSGKSVHDAIRATFEAALAPCNPTPLPVAKPRSILMVGINGAGKTSTCGKLAAHYKAQGNQVILAAGDTFRAAAVEQLQAWGAKTGCDVIAQPHSNDSASVIYDALSSATAKTADYLIADTSGRLHTQGNLMAELSKIKRVMQKIHPEAPTATWLVLDASLGQNSLTQAEKFHEAIELTGLILTKIDGAAKGGCIFNIAKTFKIPIYYIGTGEGVNDLSPFNSIQFVDNLLKNTSKT